MTPRSEPEPGQLLRPVMDVHWQFDYALDQQQLDALYAKSKRLQWDAAVDIDWQRPIDASRPLVDESLFRLEALPSVQRASPARREQLRAELACNHLSQFLHGEQGALMTAAALTHAVPDHQAKLYAATQTMDEARHVEAFTMYLNRLGRIYPMSPHLRRLIDATLTADHWVKMAIGMNMVVEGLALGTFHNMARATTCEVLRDVLTLVIRDEARHVAFGNVYVSQAIDAMHADERESVADFAFEAVGIMRESRARRSGFEAGFLAALERAGFDPEDLLRDIVALRRAGQRVEVPVDQVHAFKPAPSVYELGPLTLKHPAHELLLVSSNGWDAVGAKWYGYVSFWVNRSGAPLDRLGARPDGQGSSLGDAVDFLLQQRKH